MSADHEPPPSIGDRPAPDLADRLDRLLRRAVDRRRRVAHGLLGVAAADGSWAWQGAHGQAGPGRGPVTTGSRYPIASVTKLFTAAIVMRLVERGRLALDDRMVDHLPEGASTGLHVRDGVDRTDQITVGNLLAHTSGLADYYEEAPPGGRSAQARLLAGEDAPMPFEEVLRTVREDLSPHFPPQPSDAPAQRARYADTNFQLLGAVVEQVVGRPLREVLRDELIDPLGLADTASYPDPPPSGAAPDPDVDVTAGTTVLRPEGALAHQVADGGIVSTLADQIRFMQAVVGGRVFDDPATWERMHARVNRVFFPVDYGLGVMRYAPPRWMSPLFPIPPIVGHTGSTATWLVHCPELDVVVAGTFDVAMPPLPFRFLPHVLRAVGASSAR